MYCISLFIFTMCSQQVVPKSQFSSTSVGLLIHEKLSFKLLLKTYTQLYESEEGHPPFNVSGWYGSIWGTGYRDSQKLAATVLLKHPVHFKTQNAMQIIKKWDKNVFSSRLLEFRSVCVDVPAQQKLISWLTSVERTCCNIIHRSEAAAKLLLWSLIVLVSYTPRCVLLTTVTELVEMLHFRVVMRTRGKGESSNRANDLLTIV